MSTPKATDHLDTESGRLIPVAQDANETTETEPVSASTFSPSQSPTPAPKVTPITEQPTGQWFGDVIEDLLDGAKVRRLSWPEGECVLFESVLLSEDATEPVDILRIQLADGSRHRWTISRADLENADDWIVISESAGVEESEDKMYHPQS